MSILIVAIVFLFTCSLPAQEVGQEKMKELAIEVAGLEGSAFVKTQRLVEWMNESFEWSYTDYQNRSVEEIIQRGAGNCAEQGRVLSALLEALNIPARRVREINIHPRSESRKKNAEKLIAERGNRLSVFGYMHNDHFWLEVYDDSSKTWFPADPSIGIVGIKAWIAARLKFTDRILITDVTKKMLVPFMVIVREKGELVEDRSEYYLVRAFNSFYENRLQVLDGWQEWVSLIEQLSQLGASAFAGEENLHNYTHLIEQLLVVYDNLKYEYLERQSRK